MSDNLTHFFALSQTKGSAMVYDLLTLSTHTHTSDNGNGNDNE